MARPRKNNADYFSHDNNMRNHRKIKAVRNTFGLEGYAIFNMLLETLAECDNFNIKLESDIDWEVLASDFGIEVERLKNMVEYFIKLELIKVKDCKYCSDNLIERLGPLVEKREYLRDKYAETIVSTTETPVSTSEMPHSKVNKSKEISPSTIGNYLATRGVVSGKDYQPDFKPPKKMKMGGAYKNKGQEFGAMVIRLAGKFNELYKERFGEEYLDGSFSVDPIASQVSKGKKQGLTEENFSNIIEDYFKSKKSQDLAVTLTACFSDHTMLSWKQHKTKKQGTWN